MKAFKGFTKDLTATLGRGIFQFEPGKTYKEENAKCANTGFHCAENILDCLNYYPDIDNSVYYIVEAAGDIHEDASDTRIACTEITLLKQLSVEEIVFYAMDFIIKHPKRAMNRRVKIGIGESKREHFVIVRGKNPKAKGEQGDFLALLKEDEETTDIVEAAIYTVGKGNTLKERTYYDVTGKEVQL